MKILPTNRLLLATALILSFRAQAALSGRDFVIPGDMKKIEVLLRP